MKVGRPTRILKVVLKAYVVGFCGAVLVILVAVGIWAAARPAEEAGLRWGDTVYTSKQEFNGYLKAKGLSYKTWLAKNPGAAPWEPGAAQASTDDVRESLTGRLPLAGLVVAAGAALVLLRRTRLPGAAAAAVASRTRRPSPPNPDDETWEDTLAPLGVPRVVRGVEPPFRTSPAAPSAIEPAPAQAASPRTDASLFEMLSPRLAPDEHDEAGELDGRMRQIQ